MPEPTGINLTISDGVTATIQEGLKTVQALCQLGLSPEGQKTIAAWRANDIKFQAAWAEGWKAASDWFGKIFEVK